MSTEQQDDDGTEAAARDNASSDVEGHFAAREPQLRDHADPAVVRNNEVEGHLMARDPEMRTVPNPDDPEDKGLMAR